MPTTRRKLKFSVGDRVADRETGLLGTIVHLYEDREIRDEIVVVQFDVGDVPALASALAPNCVTGHTSLRESAGAMLTTPALRFSASASFHPFDGIRQHCRPRPKATVNR